MSIKAMVYYLDNSPLMGNEKLALVILADYANDEGECYPGHKRIAHRLNMTVSGARKILYRLRDEGELEILNEEGVHTKTGNTNRYRLLKYIDSLQGVPTGTVSQPGQGRVSQPGQGRVSQAWDTDPSVEPSVEPSEESASHRTPTARPKDLFFERMCWIVGVDWKTCSNEKKGELNQAKGILTKAGYTADDLVMFWESVWKKDYRWRDKKSRPTVSQLRSEIGKVKVTDVILNSEPNDNLPEYDAQVWDTSRIDF